MSAASAVYGPPTRTVAKFTLRTIRHPRGHGHEGRGDGGRMSPLWIVGRGYQHSGCTTRGSNFEDSGQFRRSALVAHRSTRAEAANADRWHATAPGAYRFDIRLQGAGETVSWTSDTMTAPVLIVGGGIAGAEPLR